MPTNKLLRRNSALACLFALSALYCIAELVPGRFAVTDEVYFKAAGRNWAATGRFAAPELKGGTSIVPPLDEVFFPYPPLYPFLFGVYTKAVGFSPRSCILYDLAIHLLLVWCGVWVARLVYGVPMSVAVLCGAFLLPLGTVGRPDELGIVFALGAALALRREVPLKFAFPIGGALLGLCCATSPGAGLFLGSLVGWEFTLRDRSYSRKLRNLVIVALIALAVLAVCLAPILVPHPLAYRQLIRVGVGQTVAGNASTPYHSARRGTFVQNWIDALQVLLIASSLIFALWCWWLDHQRESASYSRFVAAVCSLLLVIILMPGKCTYFWFLQSWLLIACVALGWRISQFVPPSRWRPPLAFAVLVWLLAAMPYFRLKEILWSLPADQSLTINTKRVRDEVPANAGVLTTEYWWALAGRNPVYDTIFSNPGADAFDYIALSGNTSGKIGVPLAPLVPLGDSKWQNTDDHLRSVPPTFFGFRFSRSAYGFGPYILKKYK